MTRITPHTQGQIEIPKVKDQSWLRSHPTLGGKHKFKDQRPNRGHEKTKEPKKYEWQGAYLSGKKKNDRVKVKTK